MVLKARERRKAMSTERAARPLRMAETAILDTPMRRQGRHTQAKRFDIQGGVFRGKVCAGGRVQVIWRQKRWVTALLQPTVLSNFWRRERDLNPRYRFKPVYSLSRRAPSANSDISPEFDRNDVMTFLYRPCPALSSVSWRRRFVAARGWAA